MNGLVQNTSGNPASLQEQSKYPLFRAKKIKKQVNEKQVVFWSEKYAKRAKAEREAAKIKHYI